MVRFVEQKGLSLFHVPMGLPKSEEWGGVGSLLRKRLPLGIQGEGPEPASVRKQEGPRTDSLGPVIGGMNGFRLFTLTCPIIYVNGT